MKDNEVEIVLNQPTTQKSKIDFRLPNAPSFNEPVKENLSSFSQRSQALQSVINQNEDLMARLKLATIRTGDLESQLEAAEVHLKSLQKERSHLKEQILILKEKESIFRERTEGALQKGEDLKEENFELLQRLEKVERAFRRLFKYREKVKTQLPQLKVLRKKSNRLTEINGHLKVQVEDLGNRLQQIHSEMSASHASLVEDYETQIQDLQSRLAEAEKKAGDRDQLKKSQVEFENRSIELERELAHVKGVYSKESHSLKVDVEHFRKQTKELIVQCETVKSQLATKANELSEALNQGGKLSDQVESLQILWKEKQEDFERSEEKNRSLQKLNQDISMKLNEARRETAQLKQKLEAENELLRRIRQASAPK